ncbi:DUF2911 domain-containing protein [Xanthocytophaga agilis]|uniref:DUF2911 domain-containing protein n=1 Tax=Xanthocytophaga agilis TaxID=3048010 RepID=A0AAE3R515_9BACT|nr:DUF2911 domain-containing protein [Xanthocytophaga agilis]MDJ1500948.1 DUF2911 domain-containing protein [Xanthocytophaga agilis]
MKSFIPVITSLLLSYQFVSAQSPTKEPVLKTPSLPVSSRVDSIITPRPRTSPVALAQYKSTNMYIRVVYGQPLKRGREVFGVLQPFGQVWRTGANEATEITFTKDVKFGGKPLRAGTYTLFTIPDAEKWTIILNGELGQWGAFSYDPSKNTLTVDAKADIIKETYEAFTIKFDETKAGADLSLLWDKTKVTIPITFEK